MKTARRMTWIVLGLAGWLAPAGPVRGAETPAASAAAPHHELAATEQFLNLSDTQLDEMLRAIQRIRAMTPAERAALQREIAAYRQLPEPQRQQLRRGWGQMSEADQNEWREMMQAATSARREEVRAKLQALPPANKGTYRQEVLDAYRRARRDATPPAANRP